jgi:hypothetical protein
MTSIIDLNIFYLSMEGGNEKVYQIHDVYGTDVLQLGSLYSGKGEGA